MKKLFTLFISTLLFTAIIQAQKTEGVAGFIKSGYMYAPASGNTLNQIAPADVTGFDNNYAILGAEAYYRKYNNVYTAEGSIGMQNRHSAGALYAEPYCGAAHITWGRIIAENNRFWLYPAVGTGAAALQLLTYEKPDKMMEAIKEKTLISPSFSVGLNADFLLSKPKWNEGYYVGWMMGIRAGYRAAVNSNKWRYENVVKPYDLPAYANNAFYVTIAIGGGSFDKK